jgi:double-strand break repair protein MRE11
MIHQNKYKGNFVGAPLRQSIQENIIPNFFDLVIWGHEHESIPETWQCMDTSVFFLQPGSTVATSLIEMEGK